MTSPDMNMSFASAQVGFVAKYLAANWSLDPIISVPFILIPTILYLRGLPVLLRQNQINGEKAPGTEAKKIISFAVGMGLWALAFLSPILFWSMVYLWVHMLFHVMVMIAAPPLLAGSRPWHVMKAGVPQSLRGLTERIGASLTGEGLTGSAVRVITNPWLDFAYFNVVMWLWFVPKMMTYGVDNKYVMDIMHLSFITAGFLLFFHLVDSPPYPSRIPNPIVRLGVILGCTYSSWALAMILGLTHHPWFAVYSHIPSKTLSPMADQQIGASILWVLCMEPFVYTAYYNIYLWLNMSEKGTFRDNALPWIKRVRRGPAYSAAEPED